MMPNQYSYQDGILNIDSWLQKMSRDHHLKKFDLIDKAAHLTLQFNRGLTTFYGQPVIEKSLKMAEIILDLKLDQEAVAAAIIIGSVNKSLTIEIIKEKLGESLAKLVIGMNQIDMINNLANMQIRHQTQTDRLRKMLLTMASDIRVVLIKMAERAVLMRGIININSSERKRLAQETKDIYAPLANRLGIGQLKRELEDLAFQYLDPESYQSIVTFLTETRIDREQIIEETIAELTRELSKSHIQADLFGRAKHLYSIFLKLQKKDFDLKSIYDYSAIRVLVHTIEECYTVLSMIHRLWEHIPSEFDDYISHPKSNGYRSIHTAIVTASGKHIEIQIRTREMHEESEHGIAAHWLYKENSTHIISHEPRVTFLRQLLAWHQDVAKENGDVTEKIKQEIFNDRVYVFSPMGAILDLPVGATPLDFAYHIHSDLGHQCRGAKINGHIAPLTYQLQTGDQVEIISTKSGGPSRDWLNKESGYIKTSRARAKIAQWFRHQEITQYVEAGKHSLEREFARANIHHPNIQKIAAQFNLKDDEALYAAIGHGMLRPAQVIQAAHTVQHSVASPHPIVEPPKKHHPKPVASGQHIVGTDGFLTRIARCCKPIPGDEIIGYITQGRGVSIHRKNCNNIAIAEPIALGRILEVSWDQAQPGNYLVDLQIRAYAHEDLLKEMTSIISHLKIDLIALNSVKNKNNMSYITITIQIHDLSQLQQILTSFQQLPIIDVKRIRK